MIGGLAAELRRWLRADPREVVEVSAAAAASSGAGERPVQGSDTAAAGRATEGAFRPGAAAEAGGLVPALARLRVRIQRSRLLVLLRRHALLALVPAIVLEALALAGVAPQVVVVLVPLALFVATVARALRRRPSLAAVAQLLDERLRLFDRLGTALELERRGAGNGGGELERRAVAEAAALVEAGARGWQPRARKAPREWAALGAALLALAALALVAIVPGSGSGAGAAKTALGRGEAGAPAGSGSSKKALEQYLGAKSGPAQIKPDQVTPSEIRPAAHRRGGAAGQRANGETYVTPAAQAQGRFSFEDEALNDESGRTHTGGAAAAGGHSAAAAGGSAKGGGSPGESENEGGGGGQQGGGGKGQAAGQPGGAQGHSQAPPGAQSGNGADPVPGAPASKAAAAAKGSGAVGAPGTSTKGQSTAGNGVGGNRTGHSRGVEGAESKGLKLQAGYAPYRAAKAGENGGKSGERQGAGGKARTGTAEGGSEFGSGGGSFAFVPATGGAAAGGSGSQLAQNYSTALSWLERLPW
jgi:uncharacterized membrane protein YgcG